MEDKDDEYDRPYINKMGIISQITKMSIKGPHKQDGHNRSDTQSGHINRQDRLDGQNRAYKQD